MGSRYPSSRFNNEYSSTYSSRGGGGGGRGYYGGRGGGRGDYGGSDRMASRIEKKVYIGGLPDDCVASVIEQIFERYGRIRKTWIARRPPGFAFVEYEDDRDAEDAVRALDNTKMCGNRVRVELSHGRKRGGGRQGRLGVTGRSYPSYESYRQDSKTSRRDRSRSPRHNRSSPRRRNRTPSPPPRNRRRSSASPTPRQTSTGFNGNNGDGVINARAR